MQSRLVSGSVRLAATSVGLLATAAVATVTPTVLFGDSYIVTDGARTYSVLDVYIQCGSSSDLVSSLFSVSAWPSSYALNNGKTFQQSNGTAASSWLPTNDDGRAWDSFVTCGARVQGSDSTLAGGKAGFLGMILDPNWAAGSTGGQIVGTGSGAGWYPSIGSQSATNPYCRAGYYTGSGNVNTAKTQQTIVGNGLVPGQSLSNHFMIGRFSIDITGDSATNNTLAMKFAIAGKNNGTTSFTGVTSASGRFNATLTFATQAPPPCPADVDGNRVVDNGDVAIVLLDFGPCVGCPTDLDSTGEVDFGDIALVLLSVGGCP